MTMNDRLSDLSEGLWTRIHEATGATRSFKDEGPLHPRISRFLDTASDVKLAASALGIDLPLRAPSGKSYSEDFATTIALDVAVPRAWYRNPGGLLILWGHEAQHVVQHKHGVAMRYWPSWTQHSVLYLAGVLAHTPDGEEYVGKVEADAYAVTELGYRFLTGRSRTVAELSAPLIQSYNLFDHGTNMALGVLRSHVATLDAGGVPNVTMARLVDGFLREKAMDVRGRVSL